MKIKKNVLPILLILIISLCVCASAAQTSGETLSLTLCADFSGGFSGGAIEEKQITMPVENEPASQSLIAFALADGLSDWTGLDFTLNDVLFPDDESVIVDWSKDSTLIAGIDDREFKEGFRFYDAVSLNWFMMDSLLSTLKRNMEITTVHYQSEEQPVTFPNPEDMATQGLTVLPIDQPYEGSVFFLSHAGGRGEDELDSDDGDLMVDEQIVEGVLFTSLLESDSGENLSPYQAASGLFELILKDKLAEGTDYSEKEPMSITCVDVTDIEGKECYLLSVSGVFNTKAWEYAVDYDLESQNVYLISDTGNQLVGSLLDLGRGDNIVDEQIVEGVLFTSLLESDSGENLTPYQAASGLYDLILKDKLVSGTDYSKDHPM
ncbi:MAG: hypothetical protein GX337_09815, partial [Christensenellaceae bacterium]|nr:hypothetical protein [Christensenellaceae bacterium]